MLYYKVTGKAEKEVLYFRTCSEGTQAVSETQQNENATVQEEVNHGIRSFKK